MGRGCGCLRPLLFGRGPGGLVAACGARFHFFARPRVTQPLVYFPLIVGAPDFAGEWSRLGPNRSPGVCPARGRGYSEANAFRHDLILLPFGLDRAGQGIGKVHGPGMGEPQSIGGGLAGGEGAEQRAGMHALWSAMPVRAAGR